MVVNNFTVFVIGGFLLNGCVLEPLFRKVIKGNFISNLIYILLSMTIFLSTEPYAKAIAMILMLAFIIKTIIDWAYSQN